MNETLLQTLERQAKEMMRLEREASIRKGVQPFIRLHLPEIITLKDQLGSWALVADLLYKNGLKWKTGNRVSASQLRSIVARLRSKDPRSCPTANRPKPPQTISVTTQDRGPTQGPSAIGLAHFIKKKG